MKENLEIIYQSLKTFIKYNLLSKLFPDEYNRLYEDLDSVQERFNEKFIEFESARDKLNDLSEQTEYLNSKLELFKKDSDKLHEFINETGLSEEYNAWSQYKTWGIENKWNTYKFGDKLKSK